MLMIVIPILLIPNQKSKVGMLKIMYVIGWKKDLFFDIFNVNWASGLVIKFFVIWRFQQQYFKCNKFDTLDSRQ